MVQKSIGEDFWGAGDASYSELFFDELLIHFLNLMRTYQNNLNT